MNTKQLTALCKERKIKGYSGKKKQELLIMLGLPASVKQNTVPEMLVNFRSEVRTKYTQSVDKAERESGGVTIRLGGCARDSRVLFEWNHFKIFYDKHFGGRNPKDAISEIEKLFPNGIVVLFRNNDYFSLKVQAEPEPITSEVLLRLGSNELLSSIIYISSEGSSSRDVQHLVELVKSDVTLKPLKKAGTKKNMTHRSTATTSSNAFWTGHYSYRLKGGSETIGEGMIPLGNDIYDFATKETVLQVFSQLVFMMLHSENPEKLVLNDADIEEMKTFHSAQIGGLDIKKYGVTVPFDAETGALICYTSTRPIRSEQFLTNTGSDRIELCHIRPKSELDVRIVNGKIETSFSPYNLVWGISRYNVAMQTTSEEEFWRDMEEVIAMRSRQKRMREQLG